MVVLNTVSIAGPAYTMAKTGSPILAGASAATSYGIKKTTGHTPGEHINSLVKNNSSLKEEESYKKSAKQSTLHL